MESYKKTQVGKYEIRYDSKEQYGYWEHDDFGEVDGGSFTVVNGEVEELDGCFAVPDEVAFGIEELGIKIDKDLFCF